MEQALQQARKYASPVIVHAITQKGKGYNPALLNEDDQFHAVGKIDQRPVSHSKIIQQKLGLMSLVTRL
jgi:deoxyxylulose-5-phosphate synthase